MQGREGTGVQVSPEKAQKLSPPSAHSLPRQVSQASEDREEEREELEREEEREEEDLLEEEREEEERLEELLREED